LPFPVLGSFTPYSFIITGLLLTNNVLYAAFRAGNIEVVKRLFPRINYVDRFEASLAFSTCLSLGP
jgi:hypothetical protein